MITVLGFGALTPSAVTGSLPVFTALPLRMTYSNDTAGAAVFGSNNRRNDHKKSSLVSARPSDQRKLSRKVKV